MKKNLAGFAGNVLVAFNVFVIFLLIFENKIVVPFWLQSIGRMHPLIIHFSIVILILAMFLEFFRFKTEFNTQDLYHRFASNLLLAGALLAGITVIMGIFLSREGGYSGSTLQWHKWFGVSILFVSSAIYWSRNSAWYKAPYAKAGAILTFFCLLFAGHYGGTLSHGENFVLEPVLARFEKKVPVDEAIVFDHVIQPIFKEKCFSCHSQSKSKGELILTNVNSILKGGKDGKLFIPGKPELSLLLKRIHLPESDKKHMPPKQEVQLSDDEIALLFYWIKGNADFKKKVVDLPYSDSLRILSTAYLKPVEKEEQFDFAAADGETIKKLNNSYRVVTPIAKESPALAVNIYNKNIYTPKVLDELAAVKKQIIFLELNKMPVENADLKYVSRFQNLRTLDLNFTDITGEGLKELTSLDHLKSLSVSGTKVDFENLRKQIGEFKSLRTLTLWNTEIEESDVKELQKANNNVKIIYGFKDDGKNPIKLPPPTLKNKNTIFSTSIPVQIKNPVNGAEIRYTTDGSIPDSIKSPVFKNEVVLTKNTTIRAIAYKKGWISSDTAEFHFHISKYKPDTVIMLTAVDPDRQAEGVRTFFDNVLGTTTLPRSTSEKWIGYNKNDMEVLLQFKKEKLISSVALNTLVKPGSGIYPPALVQIWGGTSRNNMQLLSTIRPKPATRETNDYIEVLDGRFSPRQLSYIKVVAKPIPDVPKPDEKARAKALAKTIASLLPKDRAIFLAKQKEAKAKADAERKKQEAERRKKGGAGKGKDGRGGKSGRPQPQKRPGFILVDEIFIN